MDAPWPPVYPKQPNEPPRVAPSRAKKPKAVRIVEMDLWDREAAHRPRPHARRHALLEEGAPLGAVGEALQQNGAPAQEGPGPVLVGAKLNRIDTEAIGGDGVTLAERSGALPDAEVALYDEGDFRLRVLTSGGFSPDGVTGLRPDMFEDLFRLHAKDANGGTLIMDKVGRTAAHAAALNAQLEDAQRARRCCRTSRGGQVAP